MADTSLSVIQLAAIMQDSIVELANQQAKMFRYFPVKSFQGKNVSWVADGYDGTAAANFAEGGSLATYGVDTQLNPVLDSARVHSSRNITGTLLRAAKASLNPAEAIDEMKAQLEAAIKAVAVKCNSQAFTGSGSNAIIGLQSAVDNSNTYAGLSRITYPSWSSYVVDPGVSTAISAALLRSDMIEVEKRCGIRPNLVLTSFGVLNKIMALGDSNRVEQPANSLYQVGYDGVSLMGVPVIADKDCPAGCVFYLDRDAVEWRVRDAVVQGEQLIQGMDQSGKLSVPFIFKSLPQTTDSVGFAAIFEGQLVVRAPHHCGTRRNVTE